MTVARWPGLAALVALAGCASPAPPAAPLASAEPASSAPPAPAPAADASARLVARVLRRVAQIRQLPARGEVKSQALARPALLDRVKKQAGADIPPGVVQQQSTIMQALGWIPPGYDLERGSLDLLEAQLAGFYDPESKTMFLALDQPAAEAEATLAHELVHALQDQHYDLGPKLKYQAEAGDAPSALQALAEGDATSAMTDFMLAGKGGLTAIDLPEHAMTAAMAEQTMASAASVPALLKASLIAPYIDGLRFVHALRRRGGWAEVDRAWKSPPTTTEQLLHLDRYDAREPPLAVPPPPTSALGGGFRVLLSDQLGEQSLRIVLALQGSDAEARQGAAGWGGDRVALMTRTREGHEELLVTWWLRFDGAGARCPDAIEAHTLLRRGFLPQRGEKPQAPVCRERPDLGPMAMAISGCDVLITAGPFEREGAGWRSRGGCEAARASISEVIKQP